VFEMSAQPVWMTLGGDAVPLAAIASWTIVSLFGAGIVQTA
jgi:hypothetical protein